MKIVIGLVGEKGSGKQTFVNFLKEIAPELNIRQVRFSDILAQTLILWDIPVTRAHLQNLSVVMNETFGQTALAKAAKFSLEGDNPDVVILDGVRRSAEAIFVRSFKNSTLIYITARQKLRYQRLKAKSEKVGEAGLSFEQFLQEEKSKAEKGIPQISKRADLKIENNSSLAKFKKEVMTIYKQLLL